jgi:hypothetical protein
MRQSTIEQVLHNFGLFQQGFLGSDHELFKSQFFWSRWLIATKECLPARGPTTVLTTEPSSSSIYITFTLRVLTFWAHNTVLAAR